MNEFNEGVEAAAQHLEKTAQGWLKEVSELSWWQRTMVYDQSQAIKLIDMLNGLAKEVREKKKSETV